MSQPKPMGALSSYSNGVARELHHPVILGNLDSGDTQQFDGLWDTGATNTMITQKVVDELKLRPMGKVHVSTPSGGHDADTFFVSLTFPGSVLRYGGVRVTQGILGNCEVLIGMDIIASGDFAVTQKGGKTLMSFQAPHGETIDYVEDMTRRNEQERKSQWMTPNKKKQHRKHRG